MTEGARPTLAYEEVGAGSPVLLVHGFAGTARSHFGPLIEALAPDYRVIAPDLSGHGRSASIPRQVDSRLHHHDAADLLALLDTLGLREPEQINIIGYSDGGETAIILAALLGESARSLTVWGVSGRVPPEQVVAVYADPPAYIRSWPSLREELDQLHGAGASLPMLTQWAAAMESLRAEGGVINDDEAQRVICPALVLAGDHDPFNPLAATEALVARLPHGRLFTFAGAGHDLLAEREAQVIALARRMLASPTV